MYLFTYTFPPSPPPRLGVMNIYRMYCMNTKSYKLDTGVEMDKMIRN
jgi:hypothetical protein